MDYSNLHNPDAARALYYQLIRQDPNDVLKAQRSILDSHSRKIARILTRLNEEPDDAIRHQLFFELRATRFMKAEQLAIVSQLEATIASAQGTNPEHLDPFGEFDQLFGLPGVEVIGTEIDKLVVIVKIRMEHGGVRYNMGDWKITAGNLEFRTHLIQSGKKRNWIATKSPCHIINGNQFCFGSNKTIIWGNARKQQYVQAIRIAVHCMTTIHPNDLYLLPQAFHIATD